MKNNCAHANFWEIDSDFFHLDIYDCIRILSCIHTQIEREREPQ